MNDKITCPYQGPNKENPEYIGEYDLIRPTNNPLDSDYWITSGTSTTFDAGANEGTGGYLEFDDLLKISKGATGACDATVTLDIEANPFIFSYYPPHSLDVIFVLDVTSSMMSGGSHKMAQAKRALIQTINLLWDSNKDTKVTIVPYARDKFMPNPNGGFDYDYLGTFFTWRRPTTSGHTIGQILGYRNGSFVNSTDMQTYMTQSTPIANSVAESLYNSYNYYKISYSDIYNEDGTQKIDSILQTYLDTVYTADPTKYTGNFITAIATGTELTPQQLSYSMNDTGYENNTILENMIWAIPYGEDTNTEAGLKAGYNLMKTPGFAQSDDIHRRAVILITDGQANRSINPDFQNVYATQTSINADFQPDNVGEPWKYFMYLLQTVPDLINDVNNRSSTNDELVLALERAYEIASKIKDPNDGNASVFVLGIEIDAQTPGPYTKEDVIEIMKTIASTASYLKQATSDGTIIIEELEKLVGYLFILTSGMKAILNDTINTALFEYIPGSLNITGTQDGIILKQISAADITDPTDPEYTVYKKPALLPDVSDENVNEGVINIDLTKIPFQLTSPNSQTTLQISYDIRNKGSAHGTHLHTDNDINTYIDFLEPNHPSADSSMVAYDNPPRRLFFHTPIVACDSNLTIQKFVALDENEIVYKSVNALTSDTAYYQIILTNYTDEDMTITRLYDVLNVNSFSEAINSSDKIILGENITLLANQSLSFQIQTALADFENDILNNYTVVEMEEETLYDNASVNLDPAADIAVIKTAPASALRGKNIEFKLHVHNYGPNTASNVILTDQIIPSILYQEYSIDNGLSWNPWNGQYVIGNMNSGQSRTILIKGLLGYITSSPFYNTAIVSSNTVDPNPYNNESTTKTVIIETGPCCNSICSSCKKRC